MMSTYHGSNVLMRNKDSPGRESMGIVSSMARGRSHIGSTKMNDFFDLDFSNSRSNSWRIIIHDDYFTPTT